MKGEVLIVSQSDDTATNSVCNWLLYYQVPFTRLNDEVSIRSIQSISLKNDFTEIIIRHGNLILNLMDFKVIWFRRGHLKFQYYYNPNDFMDETIADIIQQQLKSETASIEDFIESAIKDRTINIPSKYNIDKLTAMKVARECGLKIPNSIMFNGSVGLSSDKKYFIKPNMINLNSYSKKFLNLYSPHSVIRNSTKLSSHLTMIQDYISKKFELRIFYFCDFVYCVAIMSQSISSTRHDSRNIEDKNIRYLPFQLDSLLISKIKMFMIKMKLESGSIDMIYTKENEYVFLEVNPIGQFDYIGAWSGKCITKNVALILKDKYEEI